MQQNIPEAVRHHPGTVFALSCVGTLPGPLDTAISSKDIDISFAAYRLVWISRLSCLSSSKALPSVSTLPMCLTDAIHQVFRRSCIPLWSVITMGALLKTVMWLHALQLLSILERASTHERS